MGTYCTWQADDWLQFYKLATPVFHHLTKNWIGGDGCMERNRIHFNGAETNVRIL